MLVLKRDIKLTGDFVEEQVIYRKGQYDGFLVFTIAFDRNRFDYCRSHEKRCLRSGQGSNFVVCYWHLIHCCVNSFIDAW